MNARISPRKPFGGNIIFEDEFQNPFLYFLADNLSASGVFIRSAFPLKEGSKVFLKFYLTPETPPIRTSATIMRQHTPKRGPGRRKPVAQGVGLRFTSLSPADFVRIREFVEKI